MSFGRRRDNWAEYRARVAALKAQGVVEKEAHIQAGQERLAKQADRRAELEAEKAARFLRAMHCQICERDILADGGLVAHHGYERPGDGWQTSSCMGARHLPIEVNRDVLGTYCGSLLDAMERNKKQREDLESGNVPPSYVWLERHKATGRDIEHSHVVTVESFQSVVEALPAAAWAIRSPRPTFESTLALRIKEAEHREKYFRGEYRRQKARYDAWRPTRKWESGKWAKL